MPSDEVKPSDVTVSGSGPIGAPPAPSGGGLRNLSKNQKYAIAGVGALVIGIGVYIYAKHKSSASSTSTTSTTPAPSTGVATVPDGYGSDGGGGNPYGGGSGGGGGNFANQLTQDFNAQDQSIAADIAALNTSSGQATQPGPDAAAQAWALGGGGGGSTVTGSTGSSTTVYSNLTPGQAAALVSAGGATPQQALSYETPASAETPAQRHAQEVANRGLRAAAK